MMIAETTRLLLEEAATKDAHFFLRLMNSGTWLEHIGNRGIGTEELATAYINNSLKASYSKNGYGLFKMTLKASQTPIGICGFVKRDYLEHPDIGFALLPAYEGQGYAFEAAMETMKYGSEVLGLAPIFGITPNENTRSKKLLSKIGLQEVDEILPPGEDKKVLLFSS